MPRVGEVFKKLAHSFSLGWSLYQLAAAVGVASVATSLAIAFIEAITALKLVWQIVLFFGFTVLSLALIPLYLRVLGKDSNGRSSQPPKLDQVSADTTVGVAASMAAYPGNEAWHVVANDLKLGEVALIRRLAIGLVDGFSNPPTRSTCEGVLDAAGVANPKHSITRLEGKRLVTFIGDHCHLTHKGQEVSAQVTQRLTHDPKLVAAYRQVTIPIDRTIRFDGGELLS